MNLKSRITLVTGASRGVGRGIAVGLGEAGATVYVTGRTLNAGESHLPLSGSLTETAHEITQAGGCGIAVRCDHTQDEEVEALFQRIQVEHSRLDILVNNVWGGYEHFNDGTEFLKEKGFWTVPLSRWDQSFNAGIRAHYAASVRGAKIMVERREGLIVNVSAMMAFTENSGVAYGTAKAASVKMAACMAHELREHHVAAVTLMPGLVRTEAVMKDAEYFDLSNSESPQFLGRVVAGLYADPDLMEKSGKWWIAAELAQEYGIKDVDGSQPRSIRPEFPDATAGLPGVTELS